MTTHETSQPTLPAKATIAELVETEKFEQLSKRHQQFMYAIDKNLVAANLTSAIRRDIYTEMVDTLIQGQQTGQTARQLYGTPTECAAVIFKQQFPTEDEHTKSPDWQIAMDGGLILGSIFTLITGLSIMRNSEDMQSAFIMGAITLVINYVVAGYAMLMTSKVLPNMEAPKGQRGYGKYFAVSTLSMLVWVAAISLSSFVLPKSIDVIMPYELYFIIGAATFALRIYLKKKWNIRGGLF